MLERAISFCIETSIKRCQTSFDYWAYKSLIMQGYSRSSRNKPFRPWEHDTSSSVRRSTSSSGNRIGRGDGSPESHRDSRHSPHGVRESSSSGSQRPAEPNQTRPQRASEKKPSIGPRSSTTFRESRIEAPRAEFSVPIPTLEPMGVYLARFITPSVDARQPQPQPAIILPKGMRDSKDNNGSYLLMHRIGIQIGDRQQLNTGSMFWSNSGQVQIIDKMKITTSKFCYNSSCTVVRRCTAMNQPLGSDADWWKANLQALELYPTDQCETKNMIDAFIEGDRRK